jgi:hypothetical protein
VNLHHPHGPLPSGSGPCSRFRARRLWCARPGGPGTVAGMVTANIHSDELHHVDRDHNLRYVVHVVTAGPVCVTVFQHGRRDGRSRFTVGIPASRADVEQAAARRIGRIWSRPGYTDACRDIRFTAELPDVFTTRPGHPEVLAVLAAAYETARAGVHQPVLDLIAGGGAVDGPLMLAGLRRFALEARSEPVARAVAQRFAVVTGPGGDAVVMLPAVAARQIAGGWLPGAELAPADGAAGRRVLEATVALWAGGELPDLATAFEAATLLDVGTDRL